jgi:hypothetical protein
VSGWRQGYSSRKCQYLCRGNSQLLHCLNAQSIRDHTEEEGAEVQQSEYLIFQRNFNDRADKNLLRNRHHRHSLLDILVALPDLGHHQQRRAPSLMPHSRNFEGRSEDLQSGFHSLAGSKLP